MNTQNNTMFAIVTVPYDGRRPQKFRAQADRLLHYKAIANLAASYIEDPQNYTFTDRAMPTWKEDNFRLAILDKTQFEVAVYGWGKSFYDTAIEWIPDVYAAAMYVIAAMREAAARVRAIGQQEMTPAEIEREFGLARGTVRKYIFDNRQRLEEKGVIRQADKRTILCKRGWAISRWCAR